MNNDYQRKFARAPLPAPFIFSTSGIILKSQIQNISLGGVLLPLIISLMVDTGGTTGYQNYFYIIMALIVIIFLIIYNIVIY